MLLQTREALVSAMQNRLVPEFLFFWGHQKSKDGSMTRSCLSQWWQSGFTIEGTHYATAEHYMMAEKARLFGDEGIISSILHAETPKEAKALGRKISGFDEAKWLEQRVSIVTRGNYAKFSQNAALQRFLMGTGDRILVEASPVDPIWGIGLAEDDPKAKIPSQWNGLNLLGFALMTVREQLRSALAE
jgi:ribA/ribD-fused uncharacterized protein